VILRGISIHRPFSAGIPNNCTFSICCYVNKGNDFFPLSHSLAKLTPTQLLLSLGNLSRKELLQRLKNEEG
jgi:hypothetical protein